MNSDILPELGISDLGGVEQRKLPLAQLSLGDREAHLGALYRMY